ncbi:MAG TPA: DUF1290 domain-containing protein [Thermodesulfobium narugense]|uniref:Small basic protein n=1 Tax=Thermodesulfobium acidiphilum TaxID=1794699 RepID=A0A2R4VZN0_THEAF|nr:small basic family protein [Thermodesulfobium acidiphilum]AWB10011.1 Small basic protein [Thermodesulfobium acidiphilum]PMP86090.1 MAG: DUF1290 domain-containing protein [Thermodesulfobium narugense]HEM56054.1 DUF1290 domain-containing protein [Thermodesulfobium narugense]
MWFILLCFVLGMIAAYFFPIEMPFVYTKYMAVVILAFADSFFGAFKSGLEGKFSGWQAITGFFGNSIVAAGLTYAGDLLGIDLYIAAVILFGIRIFNNITAIRHLLFTPPSSKYE